MTRPVALTISEPRLPDRLRALARAVERLAVGGRTDPETIVLAKLELARELRALAAEQERTGRWQSSA
jgi:hypothetical protein